MPSSCAMLRCLGLALALPVVLPVAAKPRELFEIGKVDIETGLEPFFEGNMEPFGVVCVAYVKEGGANHRLMKKLGAVTEEDEALWTLQVPMAAALDWRSEESVALVRRSYAASLWAMVQQGPLDAEELVFTAKGAGAWKEKELRKWLLQNAYPTINYRVPGYRGKKHPFPFDKYFGKANSGGVGLVLVKMKDLDDFGPQFRAVQFMRPHIEQLAPQIRFAVVEKSPSTLEMRRALKVGLDESLEAELILFEDLQGYGGDVDNHFHGNHRKYRLTNFTQEAVDGFFAAYHERALPTFWASLDEGKASLPSELRAGDFEREVYGAEKGLGVAVVFVNDPKDGCKACADGREVWESVQQQVRLNSQLRKRLRLLLLDQSRNEHPEQLVPGRLGQPLVVFYPPGSAAQRRKRRQVMHALSESFYKEAILEKLQDLVEDVEEDLLGRGEAGFGQEKVLTSAASTAPAEHVQMFRKLQSKWQCFDAYARVSMSLGVYQIVQAINLFVLGLTLVETHCPSVALAVTLLLQAVALALNFLDLAGLHAWQWAVMLCISSGCSVITAISLIGAKLEPDGLPDVNHPFSLAPLAYWFQALYFQVLLVLACPSDEQSSLPRRFRAVLFLDVFGDASYDPTDAEHALIPKTVEEGDMSGAAERAEKATQLAKCWDLARMAQMALRRWEAVPDEHVRAEDAESLWQLRKQYTVWRKALLVSWGEMNEARGIPYSAEARDRVELRPWNQLSAVEKSEDVFTGTLVGPLYSAQGNQTFHYDLEKGECIFGRGKSLSLREVASRVTAFQRGVQSMLALCLGARFRQRTTMTAAPRDPPASAGVSARGPGNPRARASADQCRAPGVFERVPAWRHSEEGRKTCNFAGGGALGAEQRGVPGAENFARLGAGGHPQAGPGRGWADEGAVADVQVWQRCTPGDPGRAPGAAGPTALSSGHFGGAQGHGAGAAFAPRRVALRAALRLRPAGAPHPGPGDLRARGLRSRRGLPGRAGGARDPWPDVRAPAARLAALQVRLLPSARRLGGRALPLRASQQAEPLLLPQLRVPVVWAGRG
ncbi:unnamed protein product [Effrenium voratum]|nr:unnamed protein product [Effrenium voratum]